jgi:predicted RNA-binding protein associated with RNAse of E/G family
VALTSEGNGRGNIADATELKLAVEQKLLTPEEARQIYWSQFYQLGQAAAVTASPIEES